MRNILLLSYAFPPDNTPAAIRPAQLCRYLPEYGFQPFVIASSSEGISNSEPHVHRVPTDTMPIRLSMASDIVRRIMRVAAPYNDRWPWVPYAASAAADLIASKRIEAVYSTSPFLASHFAGLWLKTRFGLPWIADFQDPIRDNPFRGRNWVYPYDLIIERAIFRRTDWIIANTDVVASAWRQRYPQWAGKISVSWNSFDAEEHLEPARPRPGAARVLAHIGRLYGGRNPGKLLASLERLGIDPSALRVKLIGPVDPGILSAHESQLERLRRSGLLELDNRLVSRNEASRATAESDYLLLLDVNEYNTSFQLPSKLLDYIRSGRPILAYTSPNSPVERLLARSGIPHVTIDPAAPDTVSDRKVVEFLRLSPEGHQASSWFTGNFDARVMTSSTAEVLSNLLSSGKCEGTSTPALANGVLSQGAIRSAVVVRPVKGDVTSGMNLQNQQPCIITTVDAEEEFNWLQPFSHEARSVAAMSEQHVLHGIFERYKVIPTYLVTYPIVTQDAGSAFLSECLKEGRCHIGTQLHPWVTPPFDEVVNPYNSFACNLPPALEFAKLKRLTDAISERFGVRPTTYRAGRYGIGPSTVKALGTLGYRVDSSVVPEYSYRREGGPAFFGYSNMPYWLDSEHHLLEMPLTSGYAGGLTRWVRRTPMLTSALFGESHRHALTRAALARSGLIERIRLTPEGTSASDAKRLVRALLKQGTTVFTLSYHAPSLVPGNTPYVRSRDDRDRFLEWFEEFYEFFMGDLGGRAGSVSDVYERVLPTAPARSE